LVSSRCCGCRWLSAHAARVPQESLLELALAPIEFKEEAEETPQRIADFTAEKEELAASHDIRKMPWVDTPLAEEEQKGRETMVRRSKGGRCDPAYCP
jgi:hypothetical protein